MASETPDSSPPPDDPSQRARRQLGAYLRKFGNAIRKRSPETEDAASSAVLDPSNETQHISIAARPVNAASNDGSRKSTDAPSLASFDNDYPTSRRQSSARSYAKSTMSRGSGMTNLSVVTNVDRSVNRDQRAQALFARYGLSMSSDFPPERDYSARTVSAEPLQRVQKRARLRMHTTCHECNTPLRSAPHCPRCKHRRCRLCPRVAPKGVQALVEQTKKQLENVPEPPAGVDISDLNVSESAVDPSKASPSTSMHPPKPIRTSLDRIRTNDNARAESDYPDSPKTMESVLASRDTSIPRPLSTAMHIDPGTLAYHAAHSRELCASLEVATKKLCDRHGWNYRKLQSLFPLSFATLANLALTQVRQQRVFRLPKVKIRHPCPGCGRSLPGRAGSCQMCVNVGFGGQSRLGEVRMRMAVC